MTHYYIKKDTNNTAHLWLDCSVASGNVLEVRGDSSHTLYRDVDCTLSYTTPLIGATDEFHTSRSSCTIHLDPTSSGGWSFGARVKTDSGSGQSTLVVPPDPNDTSTSFSIVATQAGEDPLEFDPIIRFSNVAMQQAGVPRIMPTTLVSMYLEPALHQAHWISVKVEVQFDGRGVGVLTLDPNRCGLDPWGDRAESTTMALSRHELAVEHQSIEDPTGQDRELYRVYSEGFGDAEVHLVVDKAAGRWALVYTREDGERIVVPLFKRGSDIDSA